MKESIFDFYHREIEPKAFAYIGALFPTMHFTPKGGKWISPLKLYGGEPKNQNPAKTSVKFNGKQRIKFKEWGEESPDLIDYVKTSESLSSRIDAIKWIAKGIGVDIEEAEETAEQREKRERQEKLSRILSEMKAALYTPQGAEVLQYLKEHREYSEDYIEDTPIGYIDTTMSCYKELMEILHYTKAGEEMGLKKCSYELRNSSGDVAGYGAGYTHKVAIAYYSEGEIKGFRFRTILSDEEIEAFKERFNFNQRGKKFPKYLAAYIGEYDTQGSYPLNLPVAKLSAYDDKAPFDKDSFTIVEGDLDAYRGSYAGLLNVVAVCTNTIYPAQIKKLKAKGAKNLYLLMDTEEIGKKEGIDPLRSRQESEDRVAEAIRKIAAEGLSPYVLYLPSESGEKMDLDEYFKGLEGDELHAKAAALQQTIEDAESGFVFLYRRYEKEYKQTRQNDRELKRFAKKTLQLTERQECDFVDKGRILKLFAEATGIDLRDKDIETILSDSTIDAEETLQKAQNTLQERIAAASEECTTDANKARETLQKALIEYDTATAEDLSEETRIKSQEERKKSQEGKPIGIYTDYIFSTKRRESGQFRSERLLLPAQALTYICAPSGQGKTRLLENLAIQVLRNESEGSVLFFTLEESDTKIENAFLNLYIDARLSYEDNNILTLKKYKAAETIEEQRALFTAYKFEDFLKKERDFNEKYILSGRLRIFYYPTGSMEKIEKVIRYIENTATPQTGAPIKAVFIDYVQKLSLKGRSTDKKAEMEAVTNRLMDISVDMRIPFVLSAQLNRAASSVSPLEMDISNVADAAEIERSGSVVLLGYNSGYFPISSRHFRNNPAEAIDADIKEQLQKEGRKTATEKDSMEAVAFEMRTGLELGRGGSFYAVLAKNRDSERDIESVFSFNGNTGTMKQEKRAADRRDETEEELFPQGKGKRQTAEETKSQLQASKGKPKNRQPKPQLLTDDPDPLPRNEDESDDLPF